ncbi:amidase family protein [Calothrix sp. CCY 0018]|uniref:amidase family protein n=1 Tax=Calothrix sp. CCY 0018 TaxID=3103864 RepID=UPI0039C6DB67
MHQSVDFQSNRNPLYLAETAAVLAGFSAFELGSDNGGSIRHPAHFCGLYGLKPTDRRVPTSGHIGDTTSMDYIFLNAEERGGIRRVTRSFYKSGNSSSHAFKSALRCL